MIDAVLVSMCALCLRDGYIFRDACPGWVFPCIFTQICIRVAYIFNQASSCVLSCFDNLPLTKGGRCCGIPRGRCCGMSRSHLRETIIGQKSLPWQRQHPPFTKIQNKMCLEPENIGYDEQDLGHKTWQMPPNADKVRTDGQTNERTNGRRVRFYYAQNYIWGHKQHQTSPWKHRIW